MPAWPELTEPDQRAIICAVDEPVAPEVAGLEAELAWLKTVMYGGRSAVADVEMLDARARYSGRQGKREKRGLLHRTSEPRKRPECTGD